jgi:hypothetical protein
VSTPDFPLCTKYATVGAIVRSLRVTFLFLISLPRGTPVRNSRVAQDGNLLVNCGHSGKRTNFLPLLIMVVALQHLIAHHAIGVLGPGARDAQMD